MARNRRLKLGGRVWNKSLALGALNTVSALEELALWENSGESEAIDSAEYNFIKGEVTFIFTNSSKPYTVPSSPYEWLMFLQAGSKGEFVNQHWLS